MFAQAAACVLKDLRATYWLATHVAIITALGSIATYSGNGILPRGSEFILSIVMVMAWWALAQRVVHTDPVPGDRNLWFTLPIPRGLLLASKIILLTALIFIPRIIGDFAVAYLLDANFASVTASMLPRVCFHFTIAVLPAILLSALTRNMSQFFVAVILAVLFPSGTLVFLPPSGRSGSYEAPWIEVWTLTFLFAATALALAFWLYAKRLTIAARALAFAVTAAALLIIPGINSDYQWRWHYRWQGNAAVEREIRFDFDEGEFLKPLSGNEEIHRGPLSNQDPLPVPLRLNAGNELATALSGGDFRVYDASGNLLGTGRITDRHSSSHPSQDHVADLNFDVVPRPPLPDIVYVEMKLHVEVFRQEWHTAQIKEGWNRLDGLGRCWVPPVNQSGYCTSTASWFPLAELSGPGPRSWAQFGSVKTEVALLPIPRWSVVETQSLSINPKFPSFEYRIWNSVAPVETRVVIPSYRIKDYTFPTWVPRSH
jgi:hypothetical protein